MTRAYSTLISAGPLQGVDMASIVTWPRALGIASFSVMVATGINAAMCTVISKDVETLKTDVKGLKSDFKELRSEVKADIKELRHDMQELRVDMRDIKQMLSRRWF